MHKALRVGLLSGALTIIMVQFVSATTNCKSLGFRTYSLKSGDTCLNLYQRLNFSRWQDLEVFQRPVRSGFSCAYAIAGSTVCYPVKKKSQAIIGHQRIGSSPQIDQPRTVTEI